jgi:exodeoxyribonuclease VII large subunit
MSENVNSRKVYSLIEVTLSIQKTIADRYKSSFWVKAEMNKLNHYSHSGHCYPDLVEKSDGKVIAQMRANLWKSDFERINNSFKKILKEPLKDGIKILFCATISFDPSHGLSLRIIDIDPSFSLGELEREKMETLERLKKEGIFQSNKLLKLPLLPQRIAIISVETSKGYSDFLKVIENNPWGYKFFMFLFPSLLQGERSVHSIIIQLRQIRKVIRHFDAVAIIRGGGGDVGLSSYNNYLLASEIARFPIPVLTGIGHSTNETVAEMVSFKNAITPTELADFVIQKFHDFSEPLKKGESIIVDRAKRILADEKAIFSHVIKHFRSAAKTSLASNSAALSKCGSSVLQHSRFVIKSKSELLTYSIRDLSRGVSSLLSNKGKEYEGLIRELKKVSAKYFFENQDAVRHVEKHVNSLDPVNILKRGFSITMHNGKVLKNYSAVSEGDTVTTVLVDGVFDSKVSKSVKLEGQ